jgi:hypothetical protein
VGANSDFQAGNALTVEALVDEVTAIGSARASATGLYADASAKGTARIGVHDALVSTEIGAGSSMVARDVAVTATAPVVQATFNADATARSIIFARSDAKAGVALANAEEDAPFPHRSTRVLLGAGFSAAGSDRVAIVAAWGTAGEGVLSEARAQAKTRAPLGITNATAINNTTLTSAILGLSQATFDAPIVQLETRPTDDDAPRLGDGYVRDAERHPAAGDFGHEEEIGTLNKRPNST